MILLSTRFGIHLALSTLGNWINAGWTYSHQPGAVLSILVIAEDIIIIAEIQES